MDNVIRFIPRKDLSFLENLQAFIVTSRDIIPTWGDLPNFTWDGPKWPTTRASVRFTNDESTQLHYSLTPTSEQLLHPAFMNIAKAYLRYRHHTEPHSNIGREMAALRALEYVLRKNHGVPDITKVTQLDFDESVDVIARHKSAPYIAGELLNILKRLADHAIVTSRARFWTHRYVGDLSYSKTRGNDAPQSLKEKKLPDQDALLAVGEIFAKGYHETLADLDVMITSVTATLISVPMRIGEFNLLRPDCIAHDLDKNGQTQYYLKYWVPKIRDYTRKPIPETMAEITIEAIGRLLKITEEGRRLARYLETNPTKFYKHAKCPDVDDDQVLTPDQVVQALGFLNRQSLTTYLYAQTKSYASTGYTLNSLWQIVMADHRKSNPYFPYQEKFVGDGDKPLKMSESLFCCLRHQFSDRFSTSPVLLAPFFRDRYTKRLGNEIHDTRSRTSLSFFVRHGFKPNKFKSHSPRHMLNRLAKRNGLSVDAIAAWSSRSNPLQTLTYLDNDQGQAAAAAATLAGIDTEQVPKSPVTDTEANLYSQGPIHRSKYGLCRRSWRIGPCNKFADCLNCSELLMCKGDKFAASVIVSDLDNMTNTYNAATAAIERGERSATRWIKITRLQITRLNQLISVLNDPSIPEGSPVEIGGTDFSHENVLTEEKAGVAGVRLLDRDTLSIEYGKELLACLDELRELRNA